MSTTLESFSNDSVDSIDYSDEDFPNTIWYSKGARELFLNIGIFLPVVIIGLIGNFSVIYVLKTNRSMRTPTNLIIGNMAFADTISLLVYPCFMFVYDYYQNYQLGFVGCKGEGLIECSVLIASVTSMTAITYDRLTSIVYPHEIRITQNRAKIVICLTWLIGLVISIPLTLYRTFKKRLWKNFQEKFCTEDVIIIDVYWYVIVTILVWLPLSIQIICYSTIFAKLNKYEQIIVKSCSCNQLSYKRSAAKMMFVVILTFIICRIPFTAFIIYRHSLLKSTKVAAHADVTNMVHGLYHTLWFISKYLLIVNAALNPLIYSVTNVTFRNAFRRTKFYQWLQPKQQQKTPFSTRNATATKRNGKIFNFFKRKFVFKTMHQPHQDSSTKVIEMVYNPKI